MNFLSPIVTNPGVKGCGSETTPYMAAHDCKQ